MKTRVLVYSFCRPNADSRIAKPSILNKVRLVKRGNLLTIHRHVKQYTYGEVYSKRGKLIGVYQDIKSHDGSCDIIIDFD